MSETKKNVVDADQTQKIIASRVTFSQPAA